MIKDGKHPAATTPASSHTTAGRSDSRSQPAARRARDPRTATSASGARAIAVLALSGLLLAPLAAQAEAQLAPSPAAARAQVRGRLAQQPPTYPQPAPPQQPYPQQPYPQQPYPQQPYPQQPYPQQPQQPYPQQPQQPYPPPQQPQYPPQAPPPAPPSPPAPAIPDDDLPPTGSGLYPTGQRYYSMPAEATPSLDRRGFAFQVGVGMGGVFDEENGRFGVGYDLAAGGVLNPHLVALFDYSALTFATANGGRATHAIFGGALQVFLSDIFWLKAGAGLGQLSLANSYGFSLDATERTFAGIFGLGVEVYQMQPDFAIDLQLRAAGGHYHDQGWLMNTAVMVGFNGY
jgi:hypothetical protein